MSRSLSRLVSLAMLIAGTVPLHAQDLDLDGAGSSGRDPILREPAPAITWSNAPGMIPLRAVGAPVVSAPAASTPDSSASAGSPGGTQVGSRIRLEIEPSAPRPVTVRPDTDDGPGGLEAPDAGPLR